ncbi:Inner-membrane translocator (fragment) [Candidatus Filomicrobium marinum]|uniref:Inner-membrane translocator n=1 Tax=Candidatus Filomicrobium marinum TaxID=1608628 RepID=A0A0D6JJX1_9HYPH
MTQAEDRSASFLRGALARSPSLRVAGRAFSERERGLLSRYPVFRRRFGDSLDAAVPLLVMCGLFAAFALLVPNYLSGSNLQQLMRDYAEPCLVALALGIVVFAGGIDLSVGAIFALANFTALYLFRIEMWPLPVAVLGVLSVGAVIGAINGVLIAYLKTRAFLTTLAMLLILRAGLDFVTNAYTIELANAWRDTEGWYWLGAGYFLGVPSNMVILLVVALALHLFLTRLRPGLHIMATGADRKAARHAGINTRRVTLLAYVLSGLIAALAGLFYAARQSSAGSDTGLGWEVTALTAVVLGGVSLSGGGGSVGRVMIGSAILFLLMSGLLRMNMPGGASSALIGATLLGAVGIHIQWSRRRARSRSVRSPVSDQRGAP